MSERKELFDDWAETYDESVLPGGFPFEGYDRVLAGVVGGTGVGDGARVLDVGTGTGALAARFAVLGCRVLGVDLSEEMLRRARENVPVANFQQLDLLGDWGYLREVESLAGVESRFDAVVSAYVLHEFELATKLELLTRFTELLKPGGGVVIGDISFETAASLEAARQQWRAGQCGTKVSIIGLLKTPHPRCEGQGLGFAISNFRFALVSTFCNPSFY